MLKNTGYFILNSLYANYFEILTCKRSFSYIHSNLVTLTDFSLKFKTVISKSLIETTMKMVNDKYPDCFELEIDTELFNTSNYVKIRFSGKHSWDDIFTLMRIHNEIV